MERDIRTLPVEFNLKFKLYLFLYFDGEPIIQVCIIITVLWNLKPCDLVNR